MKYLRFQMADGSYTSEVYTGEGAFIGGDTALAEAKSIASRKADLEATYGVALAPVLADSDPAEGKPLTVNPRAAVKQEQAKARAADEEYEAQVQAEMRAVAEERLAARAVRGR